MDCREIKNRISEYIDGMLGETEASEVKHHLAKCADCSEAYRSSVKII
jgi:anti-sigma factor RsiW